MILLQAESLQDISHVRRVPMPASVRPLFRHARKVYLFAWPEWWLYKTAGAVVEGYRHAEEALEDADTMGADDRRHIISGEPVDAAAIRWAVATLGGVL
jgi:hypothetical protein